MVIAQQPQQWIQECFNISNPQNCVRLSCFYVISFYLCFGACSLNLNPYLLKAKMTQLMLKWVYMTNDDLVWPSQWWHLCGWKPTLHFKQRYSKQVSPHATCEMNTWTCCPNSTVQKKCLGMPTSSWTGYNLAWRRQNNMFWGISCLQFLWPATIESA